MPRIKELVPEREAFGLGLWPRWSEMMDRMMAPALWPDGGRWVPQVDVKETADAIMVTAEVPGLKAEDIDVQVSGDVLTISGEKKAETKKSEDHWHVIERTYGAFSRSFTLPAPVDRSTIDAEIKNGVLNVKLLKSKEAQSKKIKVH